MYISEHDLLSKEWDEIKNQEIGLNPCKLLIGSNKYAFWICSVCGNKWRAQIAKRGVRNQGCPICGKKKIGEMLRKSLVAKQGSLKEKFPQIASEWDYDKNSLPPDVVTSGSNDKFFWKCNKCGYSWKTSVAKRTVRGQGCPICGKEKLKEAQKNNIIKKISENGSFGEKYPDIAKEWDFKKNELTPNDYLPGSNAPVYWICSTCGYRWKGSINNRTSGNGCKKCGQEKGKKTLLENLIKEKGSLLDNAPDIAKEWDYEKNNNLTPNHVMLNTNKSVWWKCRECGYSWKAVISNRAKGNGCPKCGLIKNGISLSKTIQGVNDLESQVPDLAKELHPTKNGSLNASDIAKNSNKKVWWLGKCGHEWQATVGSRTSGRGCPICRKEFKISYNEKVIYYYLNKFLKYEVFENYKPNWLNGRELDIYVPKIKLGIEYDGCNWHKNVQNDEEKNAVCLKNNIDLLRIRELGCPEIQYKNIYNINSKSEKDNEIINAVHFVFNYIASKYNINSQYNIDLSKDRAEIYDLMEMNRKNNSLAFLFPEISKEWHPTKNGNIMPEYVNAHTHRKYWWLCPNGHEYEMVVKHRVEKQLQCPICSNHRILSGYNDLQTKRPDVALLWNYDLNGELTPDKVAEFSNRSVWWNCENGHTYQRAISKQTMRDSGCPICKMQLLSTGTNDIVTLFPNIAEEWDYSLNVEEKPEHFTPISNKRVNWICSVCGHKWNISINNRCIKGNGCPKCAGKKRWETRNQK